MSSFPGKPIVKTIRSRKGGKVRGGKKELMEGIVEERGELEKEVEDVGGGKGRVADSALVVVLQSVSRRCRSRRRIWTFRTRFGHPLKVLKTLIFTESCGVPTRLKTSELSAHQMPHRHPGSEVRLWIHGSKPAESLTVPC